MNVLVVNIGSTSFKFRLFDMDTERVIARGGVEGVGKPQARVYRETRGAGSPCDHRAHGTPRGLKPAAPGGSGTGGRTVEMVRPIADPVEAVRVCVGDLLGASDGGEALRIDAVGFKAVHGGSLPEAVRVTPDVLKVMEAFAEAAPAHNPAYVAAMKAFATERPGIPLVAAFETGFHQTIPRSRTTYGIPHEWTERFGIRRYGFHGASHRYVAVRTAELLGRDDLRVISCHLGGSSSVCAMRGVRSVANSFGMTPQSGLPQNNRVGDFDVYALPVLRARTGESYDALLSRMAREGGLLGISGVSNEMQDVIAAALRGNERAELALSVFVEGVRHYVGAYVVALGGLDALVFTGGIGERSAEVRRRVCAGLEFLGVRLDAGRNEAPAAGEPRLRREPPALPSPAGTAQEQWHTRGGVEGIVSADESEVRVLAVETNEELIVARQTVEVLEELRSEN